MKYPEDYINKIICGDCLETMYSMPSESVDFILADYPFNWQNSDNFDEEILINFDTKTDRLINGYRKFVIETSNEIYRILKHDRGCIIINNPHNLFWQSACLSEQFTLINGIALIRKGSLRPAYHFGFQHNYMLALAKGNYRENWFGTNVNHDKEGLTDVIEYQNGYRGKGDSWHPQAIPIDFTKDLIGIFTKKGDLVLDPFLGSGTTALAAKQMGRDFIGIEINPKYVQMAEGRLAQDYLFTSPSTDIGGNRKDEVL